MILWDEIETHFKLDIETTPAKNSVKKAQSMVSKYLKNDESLVDMLLDDRKEELANER